VTPSTLLQAFEIIGLLVIAGGLLAARERVAELEAEFREEQLENQWRRVFGVRRGQDVRF
jgi:hypothetical protein